MKPHKKNQYTQINNRYITLLMLFLFLGICITACGNDITVPSYNDEIEPADEVSMFAVVCNLDEVNEKITLRAMDYETEVVLSYNGGADVQNKYGEILSISQVEMGSIVDIVYDANRDKLMSLHMSNDENIQKLEEISGAVINNLEKTIHVNGTTYRMSENISAFSDNTEIEIDEICSEDQLSIWVYHDRVCSVYVELGHGYLKLSDYASYIGGMVEIGYDVIVPVTEDMLLTVREGEYTLRIAKGNDVGTKTVKVLKNQESNISLADIAVEPKEVGSVLFKVTPSGAAVYVDGKRVNAEGAVEIVYGKHKLYITAEGYQNYSASFHVNYAYKIKEYTLQSEDATTESQSNNSSTSERSNNTTSTEAGTTQSGTTEQATTQDSNTKDVNSTTGTKTSNKVTVSAPIGASVYFDGEYLGVAPISFTKVTGSHIITFSKMGYLSKSYTVNFTDDGKDANLKYDDLISISSLIE